MRLPDVLTYRSARLELGALLDRFRAGDATPMLFGAHRRAEAVVVPYQEWVELTEIREAYQAGRGVGDDEVLATTAAVLEDEGHSGQAMSVEEFAASLGEHAAQLMAGVTAIDDVDQVVEESARASAHG